MRKGFTLIEIMLVIAIISILLTITMRFGSKRIDELGYQAVKEQFVNGYDKLYSQAMTSNYYGDARYEVMDIQLTSSSGMLPLTYSFDTLAVDFLNIPTSLNISGLQMNANPVDTLHLLIKPYTLGCDMTVRNQEEITTGSEATFSLIIKNQKTYCFSIKNDTCKLIEQKCE